MKKFIGIASVVVIILGICGAIAYNAMCDDNEEPANNVQSNTTVETLIKQDMKYFDNMAGDIIFYESNVTLDKPFDKGDKFVATAVTNVFQQNLDTTSNVYEIKHVINYGETDVVVHKGTFVLENKPIKMDVLKLNFDEAYNRAKQSDLVPSKSSFMVLRNPLGPVDCQPCYIVGNEKFGLMFIDGVSGDVTPTSPAFKK